jgi:hypothetical protein
MSEKSVLHSLLAVEPDLKAVASKIKNEAVGTFTKRDDHFEGLIKTYEAFDENATGTNNTENKEVVTTVLQKLLYIKNSIVAGLDAQLSKEETNGSGNAKADLIVGDVNFGSFSATSLLALEKELVQWRKIYSSIPTLDPAKSWKLDEMSELALYITEPVSTFRTAKVEDFITVYDATEFHPAQVEKVTKDKTVGKYQTVYKSGKITPLAKSKMLSRLDVLLLAIKIARSKANQAEIVKVDLGNKLLDYINGELN